MRQPDTPCSVCGKLLWTSSTSNPAATRKCRPCRRAAPGYVSGKRKSEPWREVTCKCGAWFTTSHPFKKWCEIECPAKPKKHFPAKTLAERRGRYGYAWKKARVQVLAEETHCWLCGHVVDMARRFPDPWSPSIDHVLPVSAGGAQTDRENLRLAHFRCNRMRSNRA